jgi:hypothetical protein
MMIKNLNFLKFTIFVVVFQIFCSCKEKAVAFNGEVYRIENGKFGYTILYNGKVFIKQESIPSIQGNKYFNDSIDALKTLDLVLGKLNAGEKPTVSFKEIEKLKIKYKIE